MNRSSNTKPVPILGEIPAGYDGPIYYRTVTSSGFSFADKLRSDEADPREKELLAGRPFTGERRPVELVDPAGRLLPKWQQPLKGYIRQSNPLSFDWIPGGWTRAYVRDIIEELDPGKHIFLPHDMQWDDGHVERFYSMEWTKIDFFGRHDERPFLDLEKNGLTFVDFDNGPRVYTCPNWTGSFVSRKASDVDATFGYIDADVIGELHFARVELLQNQTVISDALLQRLLQHGNPFRPNIFLVRMGVA